MAKKSQPRATPLDIFQDVRGYIFDKYKDIKVSEFEEMLAWMIMDLDVVANTVAPGVQTCDMYETIDKMAFASDGDKNTIVRLLALMQFINSEIRKVKDTESKE